MVQVRQWGKRAPDRGLSLQNHRTHNTFRVCPGMRPDNCGSLRSGHSTRSPILAWHITHAKQGDPTDFTKQLILAKRKKKFKKLRVRENKKLKFISRIKVTEVKTVYFLNSMDRL